MIVPDFSSRFKENVQKNWYKFSRNKLSVIGLAIVLAVILTALLAPFIAPYPEHAGKFVDYQNANLAPSAKYLCGTDVIGRDILSRIIFSFRGALFMALVVLAIAVPVGVLLGLLAGYFKGTWIDTVIMRITDIFLAVPPLLLALAIAAVLEPNLTNAMIAVTVMWWPWYTRMVYGMASSLRNEYFVIGADLIGAGRGHILFKEVLPNCLSPIFTKMALDVGWVILIGASLSFVGLGEQPPTPSLGQMVSDGSRYMPDSWWMTIFPSLAIVLIILGFNLLGDGVRDMLAKGEKGNE
ncbi:D-ala-D-ala transporter subunit [Candidatus Formimonas warabiya]|uniref:D-ala-D-ala transporter subunit n=2 Tax=Formimonas warabiya TaxID=1761012 RepID=A0A3G1L1H0_FORW1|nr:D-ala-D-ala transporter subunit [Candidatus Formimonas warabiya]